jgi:hypothetical protein
MVPAHAQSEWTGQFTSNWFLAGNWIGGIPIQTRDADINTVTPNSTVISSPGALARNLTVGANGTGGAHNPKRRNISQLLRNGR